MTKVVILCGGKGARFNEETEHLPKPLIQVCGKPILGHIMDLYEAQGFNEFIIVGGYKWQKIHEYLNTRYEERWIDRELVYNGAHHYFPDPPVVAFRNAKTPTSYLIETGLESTTGKRLKIVNDYFKFDEPYFLTYGDGLCDVDLKSVLAYHNVWFGTTAFPDDNATITVVPQPPRFGAVNFLDGSAHIEFYEKTQFSDCINGGFMVIGPKFIDFQDDENESFESCAITNGANARHVIGWRHFDGYWHCMDSRRDVEEIENDVKKNGGKFPWLITK